MFHTKSPTSRSPVPFSLLVTITISKPRNSFYPVLTLKHLDLICVSSAWPGCGKKGLKGGSD